jgi:SAM-dependent methyltransferase
VTPILRTAPAVAIISARHLANRFARVPDLSSLFERKRLHDSGTFAMTGLNQQHMLAINRSGWNQVAERFYGGTALPNYGPLAPTEETLQLLDPLQSIRVLEIGCGSGHSLQYLAERGAAELWGLDLSATQLAFAAELLRSYQPQLHLFESPMEINPGVPENYFDLVLSIYALGWATDLPATLALVAASLKPGGCFLFSWEHPVYSCLQYVDERFVMAQPYTLEGPVRLDSWCGVPIVQHKRTLATFVTTVLQAGLQLEQLIEGEFNAALAKDEHADPTRWYAAPRAHMMPTTFIVKARKPPS